MIFGSIGPNLPLGLQPPPPRVWGWGYPKLKIEFIFEFPTMNFGSNNYRTKPPSRPLPLHQGRPCMGWGYPKMKIEIIFEILTIETPELTQHLIFIGIPPLAPQAPPPGGALAGVGGTLK